MRMVAVVALSLSLSCLGAGCRDVAAPERRLEPSQQVVISGDSVRLTYICGNTFRLRNANPDYVEVRWDIFRTADSGRLVLPARPANAAFSQVFVTAAVRGTMRVFVNGRLEETKANGGLPACETAGQETPWPDSSAVSNTRRRDLMIAVVAGADTSFMSRSEFAIIFHDSVSDAGRRAYVSLHRGVVVVNRGRAMGVIAAFPASDPNREAVLRLRSLLRRDPRVINVAASYALQPTIDGRYPREDPAWITPELIETNAALWYHRAIRLPQAWAARMTGRLLQDPTSQYSSLSRRSAMLT